MSHARSSRLVALSLVVPALAGSSVACSSSASSEDDVGQITAAISQVPPQVGCIEIDVTGSGRSVDRRFDVTVGQSVVLAVSGLPLGQDTFVGLAYPGACSAVASVTQATWVSDPTGVVLSAQQVVAVSLTLHPNGESTVSVGFQGDDGGTDAQTLTCAAPQVLCGATCANTVSDPANCGACGQACVNGANESASACANGVCTVGVCNAGFADCDGNPTDGCESNVLSSPTSCGRCGVVCATPNGAPACTNGNCAIAQCNVGFANCDGLAANGCETNTQTSPSNCGACGHVCTGLVQACSNGVCAL